MHMQCLTITVGLYDLLQIFPHQSSQSPLVRRAPSMREHHRGINNITVDKLPRKSEGGITIRSQAVHSNSAFLIQYYRDGSGMTLGVTSECSVGRTVGRVP